jgi:hypothetical protein
MKTLVIITAITAVGLCVAVAYLVTMFEGLRAQISTIETNQVTKVTATVREWKHIDGTIGTNAVRQYVGLQLRDDGSVTWVAGKVERR